MNIYLIIEDTYGAEVYSKWIKYINPQYTFKSDLTDISKNNIYLVSGGGFPYYYEMIEAGIEDMKATDVFDRLVVSVDSEEQTFNEKYEEVDLFIKSKKLLKEHKIIIQHFCLETWALGNRSIITRNPQSTILRVYQQLFNVLDSDPELLPPYEEEELNRAQFAEKYLRALLNEKYRNLTYSKNNPKVLLNRQYFNRVKSRFLDTNHIKSFESFLNAFI